MAWLFLDSARPDRFRVGMIGPLTRVRTVRGRTHRLLPAIFSSVSSKELQQVEGVCVVKGPGSFSAVRTGTLIANLLARLVKKPLVGVSVEDAEDLTALAGRLKRFTREKYVAPVYDAEPNITVKVC